MNTRRMHRLLQNWLNDPRPVLRNDDGGMRVPGAGGRMALMPSSMVDAGLRDGLLRECETGIQPDASARKWCKRRSAQDKGRVDTAFAEQHREMVVRDMLDDAGEWIRVDVNLAHSPLLMLYRRRDGQGKRLIDKMQLIAGEMFRADYACSSMGRMNASNWEGLPPARKTGAAPALSQTECAMDARKRVMDALEFVGPMLDQLLFAILVREESLHAQERSNAWPARSARLLLQAGLSRLAQHYGLARKNASI